MVRPANLQDRAAARELLAKHFDQRTRRRVKYLWADGGYVGTLVVWARQMWRCRGGGAVQRTARHSFQVLLRRWGWSAPLAGSAVIAA